MKIDITKALNGAIDSSWGLRKLNMALAFGIPFNRPHGIKVHQVEIDAVVTTIPFRRKNMNHINGTHACGLATAAEFCSGLVLLRKLGAEYRIIMKTIEVEYTYQAKTDAFARYALSEEVYQNEVLDILRTQDAAYLRCEVPVKDTKGQLLCTGYTTWQIKSWKHVKTKV